MPVLHKKIKRKIQLLVVITARKRRSSNLGLIPRPPFATVLRQPGLDPANRGPDGRKPRGYYRSGGLRSRGSAILKRAWQTQMRTIALIYTRLKIPGESIGAVISKKDNSRAEKVNGRAGETSRDLRKPLAWSGGAT